MLLLLSPCEGAGADDGEDDIVGIGPGVISGGLDGWLLPGSLLLGISLLPGILLPGILFPGSLFLGVSASEGNNGAGTDDPDAVGIDDPGFGDADPPPVAVNSDSIFSVRVALSSV